MKRLKLEMRLVILSLKNLTGKKTRKEFIELVNDLVKMDQVNISAQSEKILEKLRDESKIRPQLRQIKVEIKKLERLIKESYLSDRLKEEGYEIVRTLREDLKEVAK